MQLYQGINAALGLALLASYANRVNSHTNLVCKLHHDEIIPNYRGNKNYH